MDLRVRTALCAWLLAAPVAGSVRAGPVDLRLEASSQTVMVGDFVDVTLVLDAGAGSPQQVSAMDVILNYDPGYLSLQSAADPSGQWLVSGFLPDLDGINTDIADGSAIFTALAPVSALPAAAPLLHVAMFRLLALAPTPAAALHMPGTMGAFGETRVFGEGVQNNITGDHSGITSIRIIPEPTGGLSLVAGAALLALRRSRSQREAGNPGDESGYGADAIHDSAPRRI